MGVRDLAPCVCATYTDTAVSVYVVYDACGQRMNRMNGTDQQNLRGCAIPSDLVARRAFPCAACLQLPGSVHLPMSHNNCSFGRHAYLQFQLRNAAATSKGRIRPMYTSSLLLAVLCVCACACAMRRDACQWPKWAQMLNQAVFVVRQLDMHCQQSPAPSHCAQLADHRMSEWPRRAC